MSNSLQIIEAGTCQLRIVASRYKVCFLYVLHCRLEATAPVSRSSSERLLLQQFLRIPVLELVKHITDCIGLQWLNVFQKCSKNCQELHVQQADDRNFFLYRGNQGVARALWPRGCPRKFFDGLWGFLGTVRKVRGTLGEIGEAFKDGGLGTTFTP